MNAKPDEQSQTEASALSSFMTKSNIQSSPQSLPLEVFHNLKYQHDWLDLRLHQLRPTQIPSILELRDPEALSALPYQQDAVVIISGVPPRHSYIHPDFLNHLVKHGMSADDLLVQREWVLPTSTGEKWSLNRICSVFDQLPEREPMEGVQGHRHQDARRVLLGMLAHNGMGGDGTIVYYIMQEGDVKPRQN